MYCPQSKILPIKLIHAIRQHHSLRTKKTCKLLLHMMYFENNNTSGIIYTE